MSKLKSIIEKINVGIDSIKTLNEELYEYENDLKRRITHYKIAEQITYVPGDQVWMLDQNLTDWHHRSLDQSELYFRDKGAKFNDDGTDNRLELTPEECLIIKEQTIKAIAYGVRPNASAYWSDHTGQNIRWWYCVNSHDDKKWYNDDVVGQTREEVVAKWSTEFTRIRDIWFNKERENIERSKAAKIAEARKILSEAGVQ